LQYDDFEKITGLSNSERLIHKQSELNIAQQDQLQGFTQELLQHKPVQYVLNEAWFGGMPFYVDENVLIPRPETEELVEAVLAGIEPVSQSKLLLLDIGTGSGCIAIALKKKLPDITIYALDINEISIQIAKRNALNNHVDIEFIEADILNIERDKPFPQFDIVVSNPPYIKQSEAKEMQANVLLHEPHSALFVPDEDALIFYEAISEFALQHLNRIHGRLYFEINELLSTQVVDLLKRKGFVAIEVKKDLQGKDRIVSAVIK
jgi:release factor glutamine methyltransferase